MEREDVGGAVSRPDTPALDEGARELFYALGQFLVDGPMRDLLPHVLEVDLPLIVLELCADFLDFLIYLLAVEINLFSG